MTTDAAMRTAGPPGYDLTGRVAIVTGGATGIGAASALLLSRCGADTVIASRTAERVAAKAAEIEAATGRACLGVPTDVRKEDQVQALVARALDRFGRIDILVNCAGGTRLKPLRDMESADWHRAMDLNIHAAFYCTQAVKAHFLERRSGVIVNVSSLAGMHGTKRGAHYSAAKAALQMFTTVAAAEWGPHGIRVNCVAPGMTATESALTGWERSGVMPNTDTFPLRRAGTAEEMANAILFMASDASSYITGETLAVGGGPQLGGPADV